MGLSQEVKSTVFNFDFSKAFDQIDFFTLSKKNLQNFHFLKSLYILLLKECTRLK